MRFFNLDVHISVIADFRDILREVRPDLEIVDWSLSGHTWVFQKQPAQPDVIHQGSWMQLRPDRIAAFQRRYDDFLGTFDGFLVGHVMPFAMLFEKYGKPIYAWNTCRYDLPFCFTKDRSQLDAYHACLRRMHASGQLIAFASNKADQEYLRLGSGITLPCLPSLCRYTGMKHDAQKDTFFWYSGTSLAPASRLFTLRGAPFAWSDLQRYRGIVHVPYESSTMSLCEHYTAGIPLFVPSPSLAAAWWRAGISSFQSMAAYWGGQAPAAFNPCQRPEFWIERADFYDPDNMRYVYCFDSVEHLVHLLESFDDPHREARLAWIAQRNQRVLGTWRRVLGAPGVPSSTQSSAPSSTQSSVGPRP